MDTRKSAGVTPLRQSPAGKTDTNKLPGSKALPATPRLLTTETSNNSQWGTESPEDSMPKKEKADKVRGWSKKDVSRWLEKRGLVKFAPLFLKNGVVGSDLMESKLAFLYEEEVMVEDREQLLAEIYMLLHPDSPRLTRHQTPSPALRRSLHPKDREKYEAAVQVARSPPSRSSSPLILIGQYRNRSPASPLTSGTHLTPTLMKERSWSESGVETGGSEPTTPPSPIRKYLKRKSTPAVHDYLQRGVVHGVASLYDTLQNQGPVCLHCVQLHRSPAHAKFGFSYQALPDGCLIVTGVQSPDCPFEAGDRIIEVNGMILPHQSRGAHKGGSLDMVLAKAASLDIVLVRAIAGGESDIPKRASEEVLLQGQVVMAEVRWQALRQTLSVLQYKEFNPLSVISNTSVQDMEDARSKACLGMEVEQLQKDTSEQADKLRNLEVRLKSKDQELGDMRRERDLALQKLRDDVSKRRTDSAHDSEQLKDDKDVDFHTRFYEESVKSLESPGKTKEDVLSVVRELLQASRQQTSYLDQLTSVVLARAPWMLDEVEAEDDDSWHPYSSSEQSYSPSIRSYSPSEKSYSPPVVIRARNNKGDGLCNSGFKEGDDDDDFGTVILV